MPRLYRLDATIRPAVIKTAETILNNTQSYSAIFEYNLVIQASKSVKLQITIKMHIEHVWHRHFSKAFVCIQTLKVSKMLMWICKY